MWIISKMCTMLNISIEKVVNFELARYSRWTLGFGWNSIRTRNHSFLCFISLKNSFFSSQYWLKFPNRECENLSEFLNIKIFSFRLEQLVKELNKITEDTHQLKRSGYNFFWNSFQYFEPLYFTKSEIGRIINCGSTLVYLKSRYLTNRTRFHGKYPSGYMTTSLSMSCTIFNIAAQSYVEQLYDRLEKHEDLDLISNIRFETIFTNLYQASSSASSSHRGQILSDQDEKKIGCSKQEYDGQVGEGSDQTYVPSIFNFKEAFLILWICFALSLTLFEAITLINRSQVRWKLQRNSPFVENVANYSSFKFLPFNRSNEWNVFDAAY